MCVWASFLALCCLYSDSGLNSQIKSVLLIQDNKQKKRYRPNPAFQWEHTLWWEGARRRKGEERREKKEKKKEYRLCWCMEPKVEELSNLPEVSQEPSGRLMPDLLRPKAKSSLQDYLNCQVRGRNTKHSRIKTHTHGCPLHSGMEFPLTLVGVPCAEHNENMLLSMHTVIICDYVVHQRA